MSDSPIFDMLDRERGFTKTNAEVAEKTQRYIHPLIARVVPAPVEEEVLVEPFVRPQGVMRGTFGEAMKELATQPPVELTAKVLGVPASIVEDQKAAFDLVKRGVKENILTAFDLTTYMTDGKGPKPETIRREKKFDPMDLMERDVSFTTFALETIEEFKKHHPLARNINFFIHPSESFSDPYETFVITAELETPEGPEEILASPVPGNEGVDGTAAVRTFGVELIGAENVPAAVLAAYREAVDQQHPGFIPTAITAIQEHEDGTATLIMEGQPVTRDPHLQEAILATGPIDWVRRGNVVKFSVKRQEEDKWAMTLPMDKPISEKNTAQLME